MNILLSFKRSQTAFRIGALSMLFMYLACGLFHIMVLGNVRAQLNEVSDGFNVSAKHGYMNNEAAKTLIRLIDRSALKETRGDLKPLAFQLHTVSAITWPHTQTVALGYYTTSSTYQHVPVFLRCRVLRI